MKIKNHLFIFSILVVFVAGIVQGINYSYAQENGESLVITSNFQMIEFSEDYGVIENSTSVNLYLPSPNWTLTEVDINFTSIKMNSEIKVIEEEATGFETLRGYYYEILGMQLNITEPTIIYSVDIFGYKLIKTASPSPVIVRIEGWDSIEGRPNGVIYSIPFILNMTEGIPQWNKQEFQFPVYLSSGLYCLVLDGTGISWNDRYYWYINNDNPTSQLSMSWYDEYLNEWQNRTGDVFLHKIVQRVNRSYFPSEINMTVEIDGNSYVITDGTKLGTGILSIKNLDFSTQEEELNIFLRNNLSISLKVNFSYYISLKHLFLSDGSALIRENLDNKWTVTPEFTRVYSNCSIKFYYPKGWYNLTVYRNGIDITFDVDLNLTDNFIFISNNTITSGETWLISAYSPTVDFTLNVPKTEFGPLQDLKLSVIVPDIQGNITYILIDALGFEEYRETKIVISQETLFCCNLSANPIEGIYKAYLFWYNSTDAGIKTQEFSVNVPFKIQFEVILNVILLATLILGASITSYVLVKRKRKIKHEYRQKIFNKYADVLNLHYFIMSDKNSGLTVYEQFFAGKSLNSSLISGFLQAVSVFGIELTDANEQTRSVKLDYQNSKILMSDYKNIRIILIMEKNPSHDFLDSLNALSYDIEEKFGYLLKDFDGDITQFSEIKGLLDHHLPTSLIYPLKVITQAKRITPDEQIIINRAIKIMKEKNTDHFFVSSLHEKKKGFQVKDAETILNLIQKRIFQPII
ncbi:MAG: hypothetical protein CEE43_03825 [Promethearchaeota archaeon Loki_b32]|nr:MAG: hypothetical protein CEE43_03825 [Candidatus Lokiarchaeota archaeon Loki_b32]